MSNLLGPFVTLGYIYRQRQNSFPIAIVEYDATASFNLCLYTKLVPWLAFDGCTLTFGTMTSPLRPVRRDLARDLVRVLATKG